MAGGTGLDVGTGGVAAAGVAAFTGQTTGSDIIDTINGSVTPPGDVDLTDGWIGGAIPPGSVTEAGYVLVDAPIVEFIFTSAKTAGGTPYSLDHFRCTLQSSNALDCYNQDIAGSTSAMFILSRIAAAR
jgi:hypothetical protein